MTKNKTPIASQSAQPLPVQEAVATTLNDLVESASAAFAEATDYYTPFHRGLSSESSDRIRKGVRAVLLAVGPTLVARGIALHPAPSSAGVVGEETRKALENAYIRGATWYRQNEDFGGLLRKAAQDYADFQTTPQPKQEGE